MTSFTLRTLSNDYRENALLGTWAKVGKSRYERVTGEVVEKVNGRWVAMGCCWSSCAAAMQRVDYLNK